MLGPLIDALSYLHGEGFVHGHLKPNNILVDGAGPDQPEKESPADRPEVISHTTGDAHGPGLIAGPRLTGPGRPSSAPQMGRRPAR